MTDKQLTKTLRTMPERISNLSAPDKKALAKAAKRLADFLK